MRLRIMLTAIFIFLLMSTMVFADNNSLQDNIDNCRIDIENFFSNCTGSTIIVTGEGISIEEKMLFNLAKDQVDELQSKEVVTDKYILSSGIKEGTSYALIGSEKTNKLSKMFLEENLIENIQTKVYPPIIINEGTLQDGSKIMIISSSKEEFNVGNNAIKKSILSKIMDDKYVPYVATLISILMLYLWTVLGKTVMNLFSDFISSKLLNKKSEGKEIKKKEHVKAHEFINFSEVIAFVIYILVFTFTMSWTWSNNLIDFKKMFIINLVVVGIISFMRELVRLIFCYRKRLRSEFVFWPFGTIITIGSTMLGNTFSTIAYTLLEEDKADEKKFGKGSFLIALFTYIFAIIIYVINIFKPSIFLQMGFVFSIMTLFIELFPLKPMPGEEIKAWNFAIWLSSYIIVVITYILVNFTVYM